MGMPCCARRLAGAFLAVAIAIAANGSDAVPAAGQGQEQASSFTYLPLTVRGISVDRLPTPVVPTVTPSTTPTSTPTLTPSITPSPTVTLTPSLTPTPTLTQTPTITPTATSTPTATLPPPPDFRIGYLRCDTRDESIRITNAGGSIGDLRNWRVLSVVGSQSYRFSSYTLIPGESVTVHSGPDAPSSGSGRLRWTTSYIWNNNDDEAELIDPQGNTVDDRDC